MPPPHPPDRLPACLPRNVLIIYCGYACSRKLKKFRFCSELSAVRHSAGLNFSRAFYYAPSLPEAVCAHSFFSLKNTGKPTNNSRLSPSGASFQLMATWKASTGTSGAFPVLGFPDSLPARTRQYSSMAQKEKEGSSRQRS